MTQAGGIASGQLLQHGHVHRCFRALLETPAAAVILQADAHRAAYLGRERAENEVRDAS